MVSQNDGWHDSYVMGALNDKHFFVIIHFGISAVLEGARDVKIGDFYKVKYAYNDRATKEMRAQHLITQYKPMDPLGPTRVDIDESGAHHVMIRTTAKFEAMISLKSKYIARLFNDSFGNFIDVRNVIREKNKLVDFEFKCKASELDKYRSIFIPVNVFGYSDLPQDYQIRRRRQEENYQPVDEFQRATGFVCSKKQENGIRYVWANTLDRDAILDDQFCPPDRDVCGRWVKVTVSKLNNQVVEMVLIIDDLFPSRIERGVPEVRIEFNFDGFYDKGDYYMYKNYDFGLICDPEKKIKDIFEDGVYTAWIVRQKTDIIGCRWKVSPIQDHLYVECDNHPRSLPIYENRPVSGQSNRQFPFSSQSEVANDQQFHRNSDYPGNSSGLETNRRRPDSPKNQSSDEEEYSSRSFGSRAPTSDSEDENNEAELLHDRKNETHPSLDDVAPGRRRQRAPSNDSANQFPNDSSSNTSYNSRETSNMNNNDGEPVHQQSRTTNIGLVTPSRNDGASANSSYATPMNGMDSFSQQSVLRVPQKSYQALEKEVAQQDQTIKEYVSLVKYFTRNPDVFNAMSTYDERRLKQLMEL